MGAEVFHALKKVLEASAASSTAVGDEGGFAPTCDSNEAGARGDPRGDRGRPATRRASDVALALDAATSEFFDGGEYVLEQRGPRRCRREEMVDLLGRPGRAATRSSRSRTAWPRTTGTAGER